jgi:hypothetical protein
MLQQLRNKFVNSVRSDARCGSLICCISPDTDLDSLLSLGVDNRQELLVAWPLVLAHLLRFIETVQVHPRVQLGVCSRMPCHDVRSSSDMGLHLDMELGSRSFIFKSSAASVPTNQKSLISPRALNTALEVFYHFCAICASNQPKSLRFVWRPSDPQQLRVDVVNLLAGESSKVWAELPLRSCNWDKP